MPFKSGKSPADVARKLNKILTEDLPKNVEAGLYTMYTTLAGTADFYVPIDTSTLIKSRSYRIRKDGNGWGLTYGYYTEYAEALHSPKPGGKMDGWKPVDPYEREWRTRSASEFSGNGTGGWNPNARQGWMNIAWEEVGNEARNQFAKMIEPK